MHFREMLQINCEIQSVLQNFRGFLNRVLNSSHFISTNLGTDWIFAGLGLKAIVLQMFMRE